MVLRVSHKSAKIASIIHSHRGRHLDARYLGFFDCFNRQLFFEAHEVLEESWLAQRGQSNDLFYKGLIQLAGAFVHIQKKRRGPALALLELAKENLRKYPPLYEALNLAEVQRLIQTWHEWLKKQPSEAMLMAPEAWPKLCLV
jgi:predicted metal-dependent hydrolase